MMLKDGQTTHFGTKCVVWPFPCHRLMYNKDKLFSELRRKSGQYQNRTGFMPYGGKTCNSCKFRNAKWNCYI